LGNEGIYPLQKRSEKNFWIGNDLLAVDFGAYSETLDLEGNKVMDIGDEVLDKLDTDNPDSPMLLIRENFRDDDVSLTNAKTGKSSTFSLPGFGTPTNWVFDKRGQLRAISMRNSAFWKDATTITNWYKADSDKPWIKLVEFEITDKNYWLPMAVSDRKDSLIISSNIGRDTRAVFRYDVEKREIAEMLAGSPSQDILQVEGVTLELFKSVVTSGMVPQRFWFDPAWERIQKSVDAVLPHKINILSGDIKNRVLIFSYSDQDPGRWFLMDVPLMTMSFLLEAKPKIDPEKCARWRLSAIRLKMALLFQLISRNLRTLME